MKGEGKGSEPPNRDDDRTSAGFFQYILSTRILIKEQIYKSAFSKQIPVPTFQCCGSGCFLTGSSICADPYLNPDPDPSSSSQNIKKNLDFYCFVTSSNFFISEEWCKCTFKKKIIQKNLNKKIMKATESLTIRAGYGSTTL